MIYPDNVKLDDSFIRYTKQVDKVVNLTKNLTPQLNKDIAGEWTIKHYRDRISAKNYFTVKDSNYVFVGSVWFTVALYFKTDQWQIMFNKPVRGTTKHYRKAEWFKPVLGILKEKLSPFLGADKYKERPYTTKLTLAERKQKSLDDYLSRNPKRPE
jgi:hypothetical protein